MDIADEFVRVLKAVQASGLEYAACGGFALAARGIVRATQDIELLVRREDIAEFSELLGGLGYRGEPSPLEF